MLPLVGLDTLGMPLNSAFPLGRSRNEKYGHTVLWIEFHYFACRTGILRIYHQYVLARGYVAVCSAKAFP